jgi:hypothetical protein
VRAQGFIRVNLSPVEKEIAQPNETFVPLTRKERKTRGVETRAGGFRLCSCGFNRPVNLIHLDSSCPKPQSSPY